MVQALGGRDLVFMVSGFRTCCSSAASDSHMGPSTSVARLLWLYSLLLLKSILAVMV